MMVCFMSFYGDHRSLHVLSHSVPPRRSSNLRDLAPRRAGEAVVVPVGSEALHPLEGIAGDAPHGERGKRNPEAVRSLAQQMIASRDADHRSVEHTSELQSLMRISYAVFCL